MKDLRAAGVVGQAAVPGGSSQHRGRCPAPPTYPPGDGSPGHDCSTDGRDWYVEMREYRDGDTTELWKGMEVGTAGV